MKHYGPWALIAGGSDGLGSAFADALAARGINVVLVARRQLVLDEVARTLRAQHGIEVRTVALDLSRADAIAELERATADLDLGTFIYNAGGEERSMLFLERALHDHLTLVQRNCQSVLEAAYRFGGALVRRRGGAFVVVTSGAAWAGGATLASYSASKAFDLLLAESLWAEWREHNVHVLALVLGATDTPSLRRNFAAKGRALEGLADARQVAEEALLHIEDGPTWICGNAPSGGSPFGSTPRRISVHAMSKAAGHPVEE